MDEIRLSVSAADQLSSATSSAIEQKHEKIGGPAARRRRNRILIILLVVVLVAAGVFVFFRWVRPMFAPLYKTTFLIDSAEGDLTSVMNTLSAVVGNSGERDSQSLRSFGGECGADDNTKQLVEFGTGNRKQIADAARSVRQGTKATLQRGIVEAVGDFTSGWSQNAKQVNRIIVVTRHGKDACDPDDEFVQTQIRDRVAAAGLTIEFRFIGYQVSGDREHLRKLTTQLGTQEPTFTDSPDDLKRVLDWYTITEPVLRSSQSVVNVLNPTVDKLNAATAALKDGRFDTAETAVAAARNAVVDVEIKDLDGRTSSEAAVRLRDMAVSLRSLQAAVIEAAGTLLDAARSGRNLTEPLAVYSKAAEAYNAKAQEMTGELTSLRSKGPGGTS
ncbi:VWA domain-containing protein [Lentzea flava]|uniref:VWFA domain-containing protein n=1 Tax=Lentzea flava TaxID=103732 RepID=A0ABQ2V1Y7_9PSEU|nr:VWA domain-containing protein [Lentzea flava]MCP2202649.1 hypothetical protein [Lentzea flava]GGU62220.1 hypothetical protein GCM10010178_63030 [Lentzea flava]